MIAATPDQRPALAKAAAQFSEEDLTRFFQILLQTDDDLRRKPDPRVHLEMGLLRLINAARLAPMEELLAELRSGAGAGASSAMRGSAAPATAASASQTREYSSAPQAGFAPMQRAAAASAGVATAAAPPAEMKSTTQAEPRADVAMAPENETPNGELVAPSVTGITLGQVAEIKTAIQTQQKFLGELVEQGSRWELEGAELRIYFPADKRPFAEMMEGREPLEKIRAASSKVMGRTVRVCAKVEAVAASAANPREAFGVQELRAQIERDPTVRSMLQRFGGRITEVKRRREGS